jgi:hypothetical protein
MQPPSKISVCKKCFTRLISIGEKKNQKSDIGLQIFRYQCHHNCEDYVLELCKGYYWCPMLIYYNSAKDGAGVDGNGYNMY